METMRLLKVRVPELVVCPIYANMPAELQAKIFDRPNGVRKLVIATNIAETSITLDGVSTVIDAGFVKSMSFEAATGMSKLVVTPTSKASAQQRAGRAGRTQKGRCFRLYPKWSYNNEVCDASHCSPTPS